MFEFVIDCNNDGSGRDNYLSDTNKVEIVMDDYQLMDWTELPQLEEAQGLYMKVGKALVETGWFHQRRWMNEVGMLGYEDGQYVIVQGGTESGIKKATILCNNDPALTTQQVLLERLTMLHPSVLPDDEDKILS